MMLKDIHLEYNLSFISLDLSTTACGYFYFSHVNSEMKSDYGFIDLSKLNSLYDKTLYLGDKLKIFLDSSDLVVLEDYVIYFSIGRSTAKTITNLAFFSGYFESFLEFVYKKNVERVSHVSALHKVIKDYRKKLNQGVKIFNDYLYDKNVSPSKILAFNCMCENLDYKPILKERKENFLSKCNFDIADAFVNGMFYIISNMKDNNCEKSK